ncbi:MAG: glycosyltransferase family 9 protein [bacterium]
MKMILQEFRRILIIRLSGIGDVVHTLPLLGALRKRYPYAYIAWLVQRKAEELLVGHPYLDEVITFDRDRWISRLCPLIKKLRNRRFDLVVDSHGQFRSGLFAHLTGAKTRLGFNAKDGRELNSLFINFKAPPFPEDWHAVERYLGLASLLGAKIETKEFLIQIGEPEKEYVARFLEEEGIKKEEFLIALNPGSSWKSKIWPSKNYAHLADILMKKSKVKVLLLWGPGEENLIESISNLMEEKPLIAPRTGLKGLASLISNCTLFIGSDSAPLHIASAFSIPSIGLYGPTDPQRNGPYGSGNVAIKKDLSILSCRRKGCRKCKIQDCMELITVEEVVEQVENKIKELEVIRSGKRM